MHLECSRLDFLKSVYNILGLSFYLSIMVVEIVNRCAEFFNDFTLHEKTSNFCFAVLCCVGHVSMPCSRF